jgi:hypothetical protein
MSQYFDPVFLQFKIWYNCIASFKLQVEAFHSFSNSPFSIRLPLLTNWHQGLRDCCLQQLDELNGEGHQVSKQQQAVQRLDFQLSRFGLVKQFNSRFV